MDSETIKEVINQFTYELKFVLALDSTLHLKLSEYPLFSESFFNIGKTIMYENHDVLEKLRNTYDYILGDLPLGMGRAEWTDSQKCLAIKARRNWIFLLHSLFLLNPKGYGLYVVEPALYSTEWMSFSKLLGHYGFFINAAFNPPEAVLKPYTSIRPVMVLISRKQTKNLFVSEIGQLDTIATIVSNFSVEKQGDSLDCGVYVRAEDFKGFDQYKLKRQIEKLESQYKSYKHCLLINVSSEVNLGKQGLTFTEKENSIYVPKVGNSPVISNLQQAKLKHHNYIQVTLDRSIVNNVYAELFFTSELGLLILRSLYQGAVIPKLNKQQLQDCIIAIPNMLEQQRIVDTHLKLLSLEKRINSFRSELSINPSNADKINLSVDDLLNQLDVLSESDRIRSLIRKGESKTLEFKETLSLCIKTRIKQKCVEDSSLKTVVAFLNTEGGTLLIGVADDGSIPGLNTEIEMFHKGNRDKFLLHFKNLVKDRIGEGFYPLLDYVFIEVNDTPILKVSCNRSESECYLDNKDFYVRTNPATDKLEGPRLVEYIKRHFPSK